MAGDMEDDDWVRGKALAAVVALPAAWGVTLAIGMLITKYWPYGPDAGIVAVAIVLAAVIAASIVLLVALPRKPATPAGSEKMKATETATAMPACTSSNAPQTVDSAKNSPNDGSGSWFENNKTLVSAIVSLLIAMIAFGSGLAIAYSNRMADARAALIAADTEIDTELMFMDIQLDKMHGMLSDLGDKLKEDENRLRDGFSKEPHLSIRDDAEKIGADNELLLDQLLAVGSKNTGPMRRSLIEALTQFDLLKEQYLQLIASLKVDRVQGQNQAQNLDQVQKDQEQKTRSLQIAALYDSAYYRLEAMACLVRDIHLGYNSLPGMLADPKDNAWTPQSNENGCDANATAKLKDLIQAADKQLKALSRDAAAADQNYKSHFQY